MKGNNAVAYSGHQHKHHCYLSQRTENVNTRRSLVRPSPTSRQTAVTKDRPDGWGQYADESVMVHCPTGSRQGCPASPAPSHSRAEGTGLAAVDDAHFRDQKYETSVCMIIIRVVTISS